ncbi:Agc protein kinase, partial [Globisporangium splendens]
MEEFDVMELLGTGGCARYYVHDYCCLPLALLHCFCLEFADAVCSFLACIAFVASAMEHCLVRVMHNIQTLKRVSAASSASPKQRERLRTEQQILRTLRSPFLCRGSPSIDHQEDEDTEPQSFLLEYIDGKPLYRCVWSYKQTGRFPERVAKFVAAQIVLALEELHAHGFVHRDLKSGNVLVDARGFIKVIDFGFAKQIGHSDDDTGEPRPRQTHSFCGTHYVMAPEIFQRSLHGYEADWWCASAYIFANNASLGVVIYEMLVGCPPWEYKPSAGTSIERYFESIAEITAKFQVREFELQSSGSASSSPSDPLSPELLSLLRGLLTMEPEQRLGKHGAAQVHKKDWVLLILASFTASCSCDQVMAHPWLRDIDWDLLRAKESRYDEIVSPYNLQTDFVVHQDETITHPMHGEPWSSSSAESIDPEDNEKYFADF